MFFAHRQGITEQHKYKYGNGQQGAGKYPNYFKIYSSSEKKI